MFNEFKEKVNKASVGLAVGTTVALASAVPAFCADENGVVTALTTSLESVKTDAVSAITAALPYALSIMGIGVVLTLGIKYFKKISSK